MTDWATDIVTLQVLEVPLQAPPHPLKTCPVVGVAVSVTAVLFEKDAEQFDPQVIPDGLLDTTPLLEDATVRFLLFLALSSEAVALTCDRSDPASPPPPHAAKTMVAINNIAYIGRRQICKQRIV